MDSSSMWQLLVLVVFLCLSALFSASETALMSLSKIRVRHMLEEKVKGAELVHRLTQNPGKLLGAILVGNNVVNIGASALATSLAIGFFGDTGVGIATGIMTLLVLIFGEITPKSLAAANSERIALKVAKIITIITKVLNPIIVVLTTITNFIISILGGKVDTRQPFITEEELKTMVDIGHSEGIIEVEEKKMLHNVFQFGDSQVQEVMIPRTGIIAVDVNSSYNDIIELFKAEQYSRMPVFQNTIDDIIGILYVKDILFFDKRKEQFDIRKNIRKAFYTFESKRISELFEEMRKKRVQISIVVDEYGGTAGIITMQDLVEEIFGDIGDEYDDDSYDIQIIGENEYLVDGLTRLSDLNDALGTDFESDHFETIGGYLTGVIGRFPRKNEVIKVNGWEFTAQDVYRNRIKRLLARLYKQDSNSTNISNPH